MPRSIYLGRFQERDCLASSVHIEVLNSFCQHALQKSESICTPTHQSKKSTHFLTFLPTLDIISLLIFVNLMAHRRYFIVILICDSQITISFFPTYTTYVVLADLNC